MKQYGPEDFRQDTGVSRETLDRLKVYADLLLTWNKKINLVGKSTVDEVWRRHMLDSAQLFPRFYPRFNSIPFKLLDMGSGAGFPGLVLAIMGAPEVHLIEVDQRKATFLREAARVTGAPVTVHAKRIEDVPAFGVDVLTARALAPLTDLLSWGEKFLAENSLCFFLKGQNVEVELTEAHKRWRLSLDQVPSRTDLRGTVLCISEVRRADRSDSPT